MPKYAIHPEYVPSKHDHDLHYISFHQLIALYRLNPKDCIRWDYSDPATYCGRDPKDYIHLYPRFDGNYTIKKE